MAVIERLCLRLIQHLNARLKSASVRLTKWTGKSRVYVHPKHLVKVDAQQHWYLDYVEPGMYVLDVGCGNGMHDIRAAGRGATVVGIDYDLRHLQAGRVLSAERGLTMISFLLGNVERTLPFKASHFDLVLLLDVIEHLHKRVELLDEVRRVLRPGGTLLVSAPNRDTSWKRRLRAAGLFYYTDPDHKVEYTWSELRDELRAGGFEPKDEPRPIVYDTPWAGLIDLSGGFSLGLYRRLGQWKVDMVRRYPRETSGWCVACIRVNT
jgi:SAM-dependent methyltransferase